MIDQRIGNILDENQVAEELKRNREVLQERVLKEMQQIGVMLIIDNFRN